MEQTICCGDANPNGNIGFRFKGGCMKPSTFEEMYRCTGCGGRFHRDCIFEHFEKEEGHSIAHNALAKIREAIDDAHAMNTDIPRSLIREWCEDGLSRKQERISFIP